MRPEHSTSEISTLRDYLRIVRAYRWLVLATVTLATAGAAALSLREAPAYEASADVLLIRQNLAATLSGVPDASSPQQADRTARTQAEVARAPALAARVVAAAGVDGLTMDDVLERSAVSLRPDTDVLRFRFRDGRRDVARRVATEYARAFTVFRPEIERDQLRRARAQVDAQLGVIADTGARDSALYRDLLEQRRQLRALEALQISNAVLLRAPREAEQVSPRPLRAALLGLGLGLLLGLGAAFLLDALDTRVRSTDEIRARLGAPLLGRLAAPPRRVRRKQELVMASEPLSFQAEQFRTLRTSVELAALDRGVETIMVTSALEGEGKSTTVANLAIAAARSGRRVALVDLDLRRPQLETLFELERTAGLAEVVLGDVPLEHALTSISLSDGIGRAAALAHDGNGHGRLYGSLEVLPAGRVPGDPDRLLGTRSVQDILARLRERSDLVFIDGPPLLVVGDALALASVVDGVVVVVRLEEMRRPVLNELARVIASAPSAKLGFVVTGDPGDEMTYGGYAPERAYLAYAELEPAA